MWAVTGAVSYRGGSVVVDDVPAVRPVLPARRVPPVCDRWLSALRAGSPPPASHTGSRHRSAARAAYSRPSFSGSSPAGRIHRTHGACHIACCIISTLKSHSVLVLSFISSENPTKSTRWERIFKVPYCSMFGRGCHRERETETLEKIKQRASLNESFRRALSWRELNAQETPSGSLNGLYHLRKRGGGHPSKRTSRLHHKLTSSLLILQYRILK